jgi:agmatine deiminase
MTNTYTMPPEWAPHKRTWITWPHSRNNWPAKFAPIPWVFAEIIRLISESERVGIFVQDEKSKATALAALTASHVDATQLDIVIHPTNLGWVRDCGGIYVNSSTGSPTLLHWGFNGWAKYRAHKKDAAVPPVMAEISSVPIVQPTHKGRRVVLEGGSIDVNGAGVLLTTEECLLSDIQCRNKGFKQADYEAVFQQYLGIKQTIWLGNGIAGDDTHGHVDDIARFVEENTIVAVREADKADANYNALEDNWQRLQAARNLEGKPFKVVALPMPRPVLFNGERLPASYANFLITNSTVIVPVFHDAADSDALQILSALFPTRKVIGLFARDLVLGLGTVHCLTQQEPVQ